MTVITNDQQAMFFVKARLVSPQKMIGMKEANNNHITNKGWFMFVCFTRMRVAEFLQKCQDFGVGGSTIHHFGDISNLPSSTQENS